MTQNPFAAAVQRAELRFRFAPEDDHSRIYVYDVTAR
jgi:hypothetical protein